jgi:hypothetical protein
MRVGVVLAGAVVEILRRGFMGRQLFEPDFVITQQAFLGIIYENASRYMRCPFAICRSKPCVAPTLTAGNAR